MGIFVSVWVILFCLFAYASKTAYRTTVVLRHSADGWHVHYTYYNDSRFNSLTFDVERTYLNGVEETKYPQIGPKVKPGESCEIDLRFPSDVVREGQAAHLRSWWQYGSGGNRYHMRTIDHYLTVDQPITDLVDNAASS